MALIRIVKPVLVGSRVLDKGETVELGDRLAEQHVRAGTAVVVNPQGKSIQRATAEPRGRRAVAPRQS